MGCRGPLPQIKLRSNPLEDLAPPDWLGDEAKAYWHYHAEQLKQNQLLTRETAHAFADHCDLHQRLCDMRNGETTRVFLDLRKAFSASCKIWRVLPTEKPHVKEDRFTDFGEVEL